MHVWPIFTVGQSHCANIQWSVTRGKIQSWNYDATIRLQYSSRQIFRIGTVRYAEGLWRMRRHGPVIAHCTNSEDFPSSHSMSIQLLQKIIYIGLKPLYVYTFSCSVSRIVHLADWSEAMHYWPSCNCPDGCVTIIFILSRTSP